MRPFATAINGAARHGGQPHTILKGSDTMDDNGGSVGLFEQITDFQTLLLAYQNAKKGKRYRDDVLHFSFSLADNLFDLKRELLAETYSIGRYREFYVSVPKRRLVMAIAFRDRVVQWAIYLVFNPILEQYYIEDSYGCRVGKGTHRAVRRLQEWFALALQEQRRTGKRWYYLKFDISKYFYRVSHDVVMEVFAKYTDDPRFLALMKRIIDGDVAFGLPMGCSLDDCLPEDRLFDVGMPIGNLTSQMVANMYLNELDQFCKNALGVERYIRYMDDVTIVSDSVEKLLMRQEQIEIFLASRLRLQLNRKTAIRPVDQGVEFVGRRVYADRIELRKSTITHAKRSLLRVAEMYSLGEVDLDYALAVKNSYFGMLEDVDDKRLAYWIAKHFVLKGGTPLDIPPFAENAACL